MRTHTVCSLLFLSAALAATVALHDAAQAQYVPPPDVHGTCVANCNTGPPPSSYSRPSGPSPEQIRRQREQRELSEQALDENDDGVAAFKAGNYDLAVKDLNDAHEDDPDNDEIGDNLKKALTAQRSQQSQLQSAAEAKPLGERPTIGAAGSVSGPAYVLYPNGQKRTIYAGGPILLGERIVLGPKSRLQVTLADQTVFTLGPNADMVMDEFVYDPSTSTEKVLVRLAKGIFRYVNAKLIRHDPRSRIETIFSASDLRGTDVEFHVSGNNSGYIKLYSGEVLCRPTKGGAPVTLAAGQMISFDSLGRTSGPRAIQ